MYNELRKIAALATYSAIYEVSLSPKPGLVDRYDNGAHKDMNFYHFIDSAFALNPHFENYLKIGYEFVEQDIGKLFNLLRQEGLIAEKSMFKATGNINTHKGLNFAFALILGAIGLYMQKKNTIDYFDYTVILDYVRQMAEPLILKDFEGITLNNAKTYGEKLYAKHGLLGPRGEAATGYAYLKNEILPYIFKRKALGIDHETIYLEVLVQLMSNIEDGNLIHRGGIEAWQQVQKEAQTLYSSEEDIQSFRNRLIQYNEVLIKRHLSPGGAADLLCLSIFLVKLSEK